MSAEQHLPKVKITTVAPEGFKTTGKNDTVEIDGVVWPTFRYKIEGAVHDVQRVTLEFMAHVTIEREEP